MPIPGLLSQDRMTFPKIGDIRKGAKKTDPKKPGPDLTYFRYVLIEGEEEAALTFHEAYKDEPREINVFLPFDEIDRNFEAFMERYTAGALQCRGSIEGGVCYMWRDDKGVMHREQKVCPMPICEGCKENGRLKIIIPELRRLAYVTVHTTSIWDIIELRSNLVALRKLTGNGLKGIPLVLKRRPRKISTPREGGKRVRQKKWMLSIETDRRWVDAQLKAMEAAALPTGYAVAALPEPKAEVEVDAETGEVLGEYEDFDNTPEPETVMSSANGNTPAPEPEPDPLKAAMEYKLDSGRILGQLPDTEIREMLDKINAMTTPKRKMRTIKAHIEVLLDYLASAQVEGGAEEEPAASAESEEGSADNDGMEIPEEAPGEQEELPL